MQGEFLPLAERCIQTFWAHATYKLDSRFLRVLLQYADLVNNSLEIFAGMEQNGIGLQSALFWKARGRAYEAREDWTNAEAMYQKGVDGLAKPIEMMKSIQTEFEARMFRRIKAEALAAKNGTSSSSGASSGAQEVPREVYDENRTPLSTLATSDASVSRNLAASGRTVAPAAGVAQLNAKKRSSDQLQIFVDDEFATEVEKRTRKTGEPASSSSLPPIGVVGTLAVESKKENQREAETWINNTMPQDARALAAVARVSKQAGSAGRPQQLLGVFEDADSGNNGADANNATANNAAPRHPTALKVRDGTRLVRGGVVPGSSGAPYRFTIQSEHYPRGSNEPTVLSNGTLEKAVYDRTTVFPGDGKEYSFEEIRAKFYAERAAALAHIELQDDAQHIDLAQEQLYTPQAPQGAKMEEQIEEKIETPAMDVAPIGDVCSPAPISNTMAVDQIQNISQPEKLDAGDENKDQTENDAPSALDASTKSLVAEFDSIASSMNASRTNANLLTPSGAAGKGTDSQLTVQSLSDAIDEPLISKPHASFTIFEDENSQEGIDSTPTQDEIQEPSARRALQPRSTTSLTTPLKPQRKSSLLLSMSSSSNSGDENDPTVASATIEQPQFLSITLSSSQSSYDALVPETHLPVSNDAALEENIAANSESNPALGRENEKVDNENVSEIAPYVDPEERQIQPPSIIVPFNDCDAENQAPPQLKADSKPKGLSAQPSAERTPRTSMVSTAALIQSEAEVVQREEEEAEKGWTYNPDDNNTMSGFTRRTKDAMDEVMGMFQFERTVTGLPDAMDANGDYEVTASIVIPFEHVNKAVQQRGNDFAIFEDSVDSPAPVALRAPSFGTPAQDLLIVPYQDQEPSSPSMVPSPAMQVDPGFNPADENSSAFSAPQTAAPRLSMPQFEVFEDQDGPETPQKPTFSNNNISNDENRSLIDIETPPAPSRTSILLGRSVQEEEEADQMDIANEEEGSNQNTSTLNFTMSGITMSAETTTLNTQNIGSIIARSNSTKKCNRPTYYVLPMQNPEIDASGAVVQSAASNSNAIITVPRWQQVVQREQLNAMRDTGIEGVVELLGSSSPSSASISEGVTLHFGDAATYTVLQRMAQVGGDDAYIYLMESETGESVLAQRGTLCDYWMCKRIFTKLSSAISSGTMSSETADDVYSALIDFTKVFVFDDAAWLVWPLKPTAIFGKAVHNMPSTTFEKAYAHSLQQIVAMRDAKGYDEIIVWYYAQRLARLQTALHALGFVAGGRISANDYCACSPATDAAIAFPGSRGLLLHRYASLVDVESYTEGTSFSHGACAQISSDESGASNAGNGISEVFSQMFGSIDAPWSVEPDMLQTARIVHELLHGKALAVDQAAGTGAWKSKIAPKIFWNASLWNSYFEVMLNGASKESRMDAQTTLCAQVETHIAAKGTALRFQMGKLSF